MATFSFVSHKDEVLTAVQEAIVKGLEICGGMAESHAKDLCPKRTGNLQNSITHQQEDEKTEVIGTNVEYAPYVELGTRKMAARPYLRPALENHIREYEAVLSGEISKVGTM